MKKRVLTDKIGTEEEVSERVTIIHSVELSGSPLTNVLTIDYLEGADSKVAVRMKVPRGKPKTWDLIAIAKGNFKGDLLKGFADYAEKVVGDAPQPVIALRQFVTDNISGIQLPKDEPLKYGSADVVHSNVGAH